MTCRAHGDGCFDERLCYLSDLIARGWGATPMHLIEEALAQNGGVLPADPPAMYRDVSVDPEYRRKRREAMEGIRTAKNALTAEQIAAIPAMVQASNLCAVARQLGVARGTVQWHVSQWKAKQRAAVQLRGRRRAA
jgi:DNA-binding NarL/FixJ family response regulator